MREHHEVPTKRQTEGKAENSSSQVAGAHLGPAAGGLLLLLRCGLAARRLLVLGFGSLLGPPRGARRQLSKLLSKGAHLRPRGGRGGGGASVRRPPPSACGGSQRWSRCKLEQQKESAPGRGTTTAKRQQQQQKGARGESGACPAYLRHVGPQRVAQRRHGRGHARDGALLHLLVLVLHV